MLVVLILMPSMVIAVAVVLFLDRIGVLPRLDGGPAVASGPWFERVPRAALFAGMGVMAAWILAWLVLLVVGLSVLSS
jgi:hypothetical protein